MKITDACVYPFPVGDSSVRRFAIEARSFGYDSIVAADTPAAEVCGITVIPGIFLAGIPAKDVQSRVKKSRGTGAVVAVQIGDNGFNRAVAGHKRRPYPAGYPCCRQACIRSRGGKDCSGQYHSP